MLKKIGIQLACITTQFRVVSGVTTIKEKATVTKNRKDFAQ